MTPTDEALLIQACEDAKAICTALHFPDDEFLRAHAIACALRRRGMAVGFDVSSIIIDDTAWQGIELATLIVGDGFYDVFGKTGTWEHLARVCLDRLARNHGFKLAADPCLHVAGDLCHDDIIEARGPLFLVQSEQLAHWIGRRLATPDTPLPVINPPASTHGGPLVRVHYQTQYCRLVENADLQGLVELLGKWIKAPDPARPFDTPANIVLGVLGGNFKDEPALISFLEKVKETGVDLHQVHAPSRNLISIAVSSGKTKVARYLVEKGLGLDLPCADGVAAISALCAAIINRHDDLVDYFVDCGARMDLVPGQARTPLAAAVMSGQVRLVEKLLARGADPMLIDEDGFNLLHILVKRPWKVNQVRDIAVLLMDNGVDPHHRDSSGRSAIDWARHHGDPTLSEFLQTEHAAINLLRDTPPSPSSASRPRF